MAENIFIIMFYHRINITVLQGSAVVKELEQVNIISFKTNPNEAKRLSEMSIVELKRHALQEAKKLLTES